MRVSAASGTDQRSFDYVRDQVFIRAGMRNTDFYKADRVTPNLAAGYTKQNRYLPGSTEWTNNVFISPVKGSPAGGAYSTVDDLMAFDAALRSYKLLGHDHPAIAPIVETSRGLITGRG
ncbi:MAG TPA: serine hydrolase [Blastocatellia bacterium]|nr:serine hydrolase [Blastocatellia bacterium]